MSSAGTGARYTAYRTATGPICGKDVANYNVYCNPGDTCVDAATIHCSL